jgi:putative SOS response-associated peptidase YedK
MGDLHHRMPLILTPENYADWLDPDAATSQTDELLQMTPATELQAWKVSLEVNNPVNDRPEVTESLAAE